MIACQRTRRWVLPHSSERQKRRTGCKSWGSFFCVDTVIYYQRDRALKCFQNAVELQISANTSPASLKVLLSPSRANGATR
ncbi:hypothetical protein ATANTOWER_031747 [Ataeniobius toweri]|uniref:Uncharacterized protein n=1 Tax=Ataeniobius toweri TaxID=208326 RepID=A0ABU7B3P0_9TELE|nr:hypothetical protein [Ataeniobius toweri]